MGQVKASPFAHFSGYTPTCNVSDTDTVSKNVFDTLYSQRSGKFQSICHRIPASFGKFQYAFNLSAIQRIFVILRILGTLQSVIGKKQFVLLRKSVFFLYFPGHLLRVIKSSNFTNCWLKIHSVAKMWILCPEKI